MADLDAVTSDIGEIKTTSYKQLETSDTPPPAVRGVTDAGCNKTSAGDQSNNYVPIRRSSTKKRTVPSILKEDVFKTDVPDKNATAPEAVGRDNNSKKTPDTDKTDDSSLKTPDTNKTDDSSPKSPDTNKTGDKYLKPLDTNKTANSQKTPETDKTEDNSQKTSDTDKSEKLKHNQNEAKLQNCKSKIPKSVSFSKHLIHENGAEDNRRKVIRRSSTRTRAIPTILKADFLKGEQPGQTEGQENVGKRFYFGFKDKTKDPN